MHRHRGHEPLPAGETRSLLLRWRAAMPNGGQPDGRATVTTTLALLPSDRGFPEPTPVIARLPLEVTGRGGPSRAEFVDAALADPSFARWLAAQPRRSWSNAFAFPAEGAWRVGLYRESPQGGSSGIVTLDPRTGAVLARELP